MRAEIIRKHVRASEFGIGVKDTDVRPAHKYVLRLRPFPNRVRDWIGPS